MNPYNPTTCTTTTPTESNYESSTHNKECKHTSYTTEDKYILQRPRPTFLMATGLSSAKACIQQLFLKAAQKLSFLNSTEPTQRLLPFLTVIILCLFVNDPALAGRQTVWVGGSTRKNAEICPTAPANCNPYEIGARRLDQYLFVEVELLLGWKMKYVITTEIQWLDEPNAEGRCYVITANATPECGNPCDACSACGNDLSIWMPTGSEDIEAEYTEYECGTLNIAETAEGAAQYNAAKADDQPHIFYKFAANGDILASVDVSEALHLECTQAGFTITHNYAEDDIFGDPCAECEPPTGECDEAGQTWSTETCSCNDDNTDNNDNGGGGGGGGGDPDPDPEPNGCADDTCPCESGGCSAACCNEGGTENPCEGGTCPCEGGGCATGCCDNGGGPDRCDPGENCDPPDCEAPEEPCPTGHQWSGEPDCQCVCAGEPEEGCDTGTTWDEDDCICRPNEECEDTGGCPCGWNASTCACFPCEPDPCASCTCPDCPSQCGCDPPPPPPRQCSPPNCLCANGACAQTCCNEGGGGGGDPDDDNSPAGPLCGEASDTTFIDCEGAENGPWGVVKDGDLLVTRYWLKVPEGGITPIEKKVFSKPYETFKGWQCWRQGHDRHLDPAQVDWKVVNQMLVGSQDAEYRNLALAIQQAVTWPSVFNNFGNVTCGVIIYPPVGTGGIGVGQPNAEDSCSNIQDECGPLWGIKAGTDASGDYLDVAYYMPIWDNQGNLIRTDKKTILLPAAQVKSWCCVRQRSGTNGTSTEIDMQELTRVLTLVGGTPAAEYRIAMMYYFNCPSGPCQEVVYNNECGVFLYPSTTKDCNDIQTSSTTSNGTANTEAAIDAGLNIGPSNYLDGASTMTDYLNIGKGTFSGAMATTGVGMAMSNRAQGWMQQLQQSYAAHKNNSSNSFWIVNIKTIGMGGFVNGQKTDKNHAIDLRKGIPGAPQFILTKDMDDPNDLYKWGLWLTGLTTYLWGFRRMYQFFRAAPEGTIDAATNATRATQQDLERKDS